MLHGSSDKEGKIISVMHNSQKWRGEVMTLVSEGIIFEKIIIKSLVKMNHN